MDLVRWSNNKYKIYPLALILYYIHLTNIGFEDRILDNIEKNNYIYKNAYIINIITISFIVYFYYINKYFGNGLLLLLYNNKDTNKKENFIDKYLPGEYKGIIFGLLTYIIF